MPDPLEPLLYFAALLGAIVAIAQTPLWGLLMTPVYRRRERIQLEKAEVKAWQDRHDAELQAQHGRINRLENFLDKVEERLDDIGEDLAPTNGDRRSVSLRVDTIKYQNKVLHTNLSNVATWLASQHPDSPAPVILPLPER